MTWTAGATAMRIARLVVLLLAAGSGACSAGGAVASAQAPAAGPAGTLAMSLATDKAVYAPGSRVHLSIGLANPGAAAMTGLRLTLAVRHLGQQLGAPLTTQASVAAGSVASVDLAWDAPSADFQGYGVEVEARDAAGALLASETGAIDVSSSWLKFPRYGYVSRYAAGTDAQAVIAQLKTYHINALQFYDWQWKHHQPLKGTPQAVAPSWQDIANRTTAKARLGGKLLMMNAVGNRGHLQVNTSNVDAVYVEVWPWEGFPDYLSLKNVVDQARAESGGKSLIVPAYMDYDYAKTKSDDAPGRFNDPGVLLTEATVLAAGGSRIELGDGDRMLCSEYFPNRSLDMGPELKTAMRRYYDFAVAYENLLRDGQVAAPGPATIAGEAVSADGRKDTVWAFAKADARYETVNLINLKGLSDLGWRDTNATQRKPTAIASFTLRYYTGAQFDGAWVASPDAQGGRSTSLPMTRGADANGAWVEVTVPGLEYWDLVYFRKNKQAS